MSPAAFSNNHAKKETYANMCPLSPLKINKDSHFIKKSPSTSSTSSSTIANCTPAAPKPQQRHPVIIYTHSPKVIHTHPRDFMALVQKLTGLSQSKEDQAAAKNPKSEPGNENKGDHPNKGMMINDDNESTSVITDENGSNSMGDGQVNSCFVPPIFDPPNPGFNNIPIFTPTSYDLLCSSQPYYNFHHDPMFLMPTMRNSISSSTLDGFKDFPDFQ
ncbi:hypothetical protein DCAR_0416082 [Daucus carota subsp. sativus]|uniref:VQ domain-containing protein n=1 Tax=Daucus carota subsp. sativus TaxID=79200 RepID=A0AAF0WXG3_DAUCS|nr:PREDICTED: VQ motif-containing protein 20-like [Daucus carota subsp. sativus]WOG96746.1 hypothetical protein DCAR_0416082 [Daucus carota subsp. sativus]